MHKTTQHTMEVVICTYIDSNTEVNIYSGPLTLVCSLSCVHSHLLTMSITDASAELWLEAPPSCMRVTWHSA